VLPSANPTWPLSALSRPSLTPTSTSTMPTVSLPTPSLTVSVSLPALILSPTKRCQLLYPLLKQPCFIQPLLAPPYCCWLNPRFDTALFF
jgi:hypothetical protein